jgi:hypothetical protein
MNCVFCGGQAPGRWALTVHHNSGQWERVVAPACSRCNRLLDKAGDKGTLLKATGERWFAGHTKGSYKVTQDTYP